MSCRRRVITVCCLALGACNFWDSDFPDSAIAFIPPAEYRVWWEVLENCSGQRGRFDAVTWFRAPAGIQLKSQMALAAWFPAGNRIALLDGASDAAIVRHEMLHALLQDGTHPPEFFQGRCGDIVLCGRDCPTESIPPALRPIGVGDLEVDIEVYPKVPSLRRHGGHVTFVVSVRNTTAANAYLDKRALQRAHCEVGVLIASASEPDRSALVCGYVGFRGLPRMFFGGESRRVVFDVRLQHLEPGQGPFFAEPIIVGAVLADNVLRSERVTIRP